MESVTKNTVTFQPHQSPQSPQKRKRLQSPQSPQSPQNPQSPLTQLDLMLLILPLLDLDNYLNFSLICTQANKAALVCMEDTLKGFSDKGFTNKKVASIGKTLETLVKEKDETFSILLKSLDQNFNQMFPTLLSLLFSKDNKSSFLEILKSNVEKYKKQVQNYNLLTQLNYDTNESKNPFSEIPDKFNFTNYKKVDFFTFFLYYKELAYQGAKALSNLADGNQDIKNKIVEANALGPLVVLVMFGTDEQKEVATGALGNLACGNQDIKNKIVEAEALDPLVDLLKNGNDKQKEVAAWALNNLKYGNQDIYNKIVEAGAIDI